MTVNAAEGLTGKRRTRVIRKEQRRIIKEALKDAGERALAKLDRMPEEWDGFELRWLLAECIDRKVKHPDHKRRRIAFDIECLNRDLP